MSQKSVYQDNWYTHMEICNLWVSGDSTVAGWAPEPAGGLMTQRLLHPIPMVPDASGLGTIHEKTTTYSVKGDWVFCTWTILFWFSKAGPIKPPGLMMMVEGLQPIFTLQIKWWDIWICMPMVKQSSLNSCVYICFLSKLHWKEWKH